jgi:hypothetical protein
MSTALKIVVAIYFDILVPVHKLHSTTPLILHRCTIPKRLLTLSIFTAVLLVPLYGGSRNRRADDISCCIATNDAVRSAVLRPALKYRTPLHLTLLIELRCIAYDSNKDYSWVSEKTGETFKYYPSGILQLVG